MPHPDFTEELTDCLAALDDAGIAALLGEILEPSVHSPFGPYAPSDELMDAMAPIARAYRKAYPLIGDGEPSYGTRYSSRAPL